MGLNPCRNLNLYLAIKELHEEKGYPIYRLCKLAKISRDAYYDWLKREPSPEEQYNEGLAALVWAIHETFPEMGYRRINDFLKRECHVYVNDKRVLRICRHLQIKSTIKYSNHGCTISAKNPQHVAENVLARKFKAEAPNQKWLTDVTEFKYYEGLAVHKIYLSAILDLYDRRIVAFNIGDSNNNSLVFENFNEAVRLNPNARPLFHSDRGFQYTNNTFHGMLMAAGMTQSMSRVGKCIDNGPMEGFWGILKRERYYGKRFTNREELVAMIENYIFYYNNQRYQRNLGVLTPMEKYELFYLAA